MTDGEMLGCPHSHLAHANDLEPSEGHRVLRTLGRLHEEVAPGAPFFAVSHYADVLEVLRRPADWRNGFGVGLHPQPGGVLGTTDDPDHRRQRKVLQDSFRPVALERVDNDIAAVGERLWRTAFSDDGEGDFVRLFAFPFPAMVIAVLLGVPGDRHDEFGAWSDAIVNSLGGADPTLAEDANRHIFQLVDELVATRIALHTAGEPLPDDLLSVMTRAELAGTLTHREVGRLSQQLLVAGHETTASLISMMLYRLIERPELVSQLRREPALIPSAVEEFLRFDSPVQGLFRVNPAPCTAAGEVLDAESRVLTLFASANRDPAVWADADDIRLDRFIAGANSHLAFGWGIHHCIGASLARRQGRLALQWMLDGFDTVQLTGEVAVNQPFILRGLSTMPIRWTVRAN